MTATPTPNPAPAPATSKMESLLLDKIAHADAAIANLLRLLESPPPHVRAWSERNITQMRHAIATQQAARDTNTLRLTKLREGRAARATPTTQPGAPRLDTSTTPLTEDQTRRLGRATHARTQAQRAVRSLYDLAVADLPIGSRVPVQAIQTQAQALLKAMRALTTLALGDNPDLALVASLGRLCAGPDDPHNPFNPEDFLIPPMPESDTRL